MAELEATRSLTGSRRGSKLMARAEALLGQGEQRGIDLWFWSLCLRLRIRLEDPEAVLLSVHGRGSESQAQPSFEGLTRSSIVLQGALGMAPQNSRLSKG